MNILGTILRSAVDIASPPECLVCGRRLIDGEHYMCLHCLMALPRTNTHLNDMHRIPMRMLRHVPNCRLASWFRYSNGSPYNILIKRIKYHDSPQLAQFLGRTFAAEIAPSGFFDNIDALIPVPLHWTRRLKRGYTQTLRIAKGISEHTGIPILDNLRATRPHSTQTALSRTERSMNIRSEIFDVRNPSALSGKTILLIDDVATTGATLEACVMAITAHAPDIAGINLATLAVTDDF